MEFPGLRAPQLRLFGCGTIATQEQLETPDSNVGA